MNTLPPFDDLDRQWMTAALAEAEKARAGGEVPVGAVIVTEGRILATGHNRTISDTDPTAHAEVVALRAAARIIGNYRLVDCDLYVTLEPCVMCLGACVQARIRRLIYGTPDPRWGCLGSRLDLRGPDLFNHQPEVAGGLLAEECRRLLQEFFQARR